MGPVPKRRSRRGDCARKWRLDAQMYQQRRPGHKHFAPGLASGAGAVARIARAHSGPGITIQRMMYTIVPGNPTLTIDRTT